MPADDKNFSRYFDSYGDQPAAQLEKDVQQDSQAARKLKLLNDGIEQNQKQQGTLFRVIIRTVIFSLLLFIVVINVCAAVWGTRLESAVLISLNASVAVQSFLLLGVIARSLFPAPAVKRDNDSKQAN